MKRLHPLLFVLLLAASRPCAGGVFDRLEGEALAKLAEGPEAVRRSSLSSREMEGLPAALKESRSTFVIVKTGEKNFARLLATAALRRPPRGEGDPIPVMVLERYDTFEPGRSGSRVARGAGTILFEGFQVDLDAGQVVPAGQGGDLALEKSAEGEPVLKTVGEAAIYTMKTPVTLVPSPGPSPGKAVLPGDFRGRYRFHADGRWTGLLELDVDAERNVSGRFRSEPNGTSYPVNGEVAADAPQRITFKIKFPRTEQEYTGWLWTEGKGAIAGTFVMGEKTFGFYAVRETE